MTQAAQSPFSLESWLVFKNQAKKSYLSGMILNEIVEPIFGLFWSWNNMKTIKIATTNVIRLIAIFCLLSYATCVNADQHIQIVNGREVVVHSNPIPVILHRMVPPQFGRHVTQKEVANGKVPQTRAAASPRKRP